MNHNLPKAALSMIIPTSSSTLSPVSTIIPKLPDYERVGPTGAKTLWVVFLIMLISSITFVALSFRVPVQKRLFYVLTTFMTIFATTFYFVMATGSGFYWINSNLNLIQDVSLRQVFWVRFLDLIFTTPFIILDLAFLSNMNGASITTALVSDTLMIILSIFATFSTSQGQKWSYFAFSCLAYLSIVYQFAVPGRRAVATKASSTRKLFTAIGFFTCILWTLYLIVWALGDCSHTYGVNTEIVAFAVLDILTKPVFGFWLLIAHGRNSGSLDGFWSSGLSTEGAIQIGEDH
ncbi:BgTH12-07481 [Blumeria graminis f. sp. triticale]|uniref:BgTH12-07481 n=1 Tax=Blumeria graminis f. sp. triticale TaxID=1689686 RepID=A0A9W4GD34_BLUGR|nr:BgTH12-07481 [Blumeria graminis f. sp. triticale]